MDNFKKHSLGHRAFLRFFFKRIKPLILLLLVAAAAWYARRWVPEAYGLWGDYAFEMVSLAVLACFLSVLAYSFLEYRFYTYMFTEEAFIMTYGYVVRNEIAAVYHQIQNVNIRRGVLDRLMGVSEIVIFMTGADREVRKNEIVLPALGRTKARVVQKELLQRARKHFSRAV